MATPPAFMSTRVSEARYYYLNLTPSARVPLTVVCGGVERCRPDYVMRRKEFRFCSIEFVADGRGRLALAGTSHILRAGMAFAYGPGIPHRISTDPKAPMTKYFVDFFGTAAFALLRRGNRISYGPIQVSDPVSIVGTFEALQASAATGTPHAQEMSQLLLRLLVLRLADLAIDRPCAPDRAIESYRRCRTLIDREFKTLRTLGDVADRGHLDPAYLCRVFRRFGNTTPYQYLLRQKMNYAADLLRESLLLVKEVADAMGFSDAFHFSRRFKAVHGVPPQRFIELSRRQ